MSLLALKPARAQPLMDESVGWRKNTGLALAEGAEKTSPHHAVNPVWQGIIPEAELKSALTPPALSLLHCLSVYLYSIQLIALPITYTSYFFSPYCILPLEHQYFLFTHSKAFKVRPASKQIEEALSNNLLGLFLLAVSHKEDLLGSL